MTPPGKPLATIRAGDRELQIVDSLGRIDLDNLRDEIQSTGPEAIWFGILTGEAKRRAGRAKLFLEQTEARLGKQARQDALARAVKTTNDAVREEVVLHPEYGAAYEQWVDAEADAQIVESAKYAVARKQSTLEQLVGLLMAEEGARRDPQSGWPPRHPMR